MQNLFKFGHTIDPIEIRDNESEQNLDDLFKIGDDKIKVEVPKPQEIEIEDDSDETPVNNRPKEKKVKKDKKRKDKKDKHYQGQRQANKKEKKKKKGKYEDRSSGNSSQREIEIYKQNKLVTIPEKYQNLVKFKTIEQQLNSNFQLKIKLGQGLLNVDIISFPKKQIYSYGLMDKDIPQYSRLPNFNQIIGAKDSKNKSAIKHLNKIINQKRINPNEDQVSKHRYFNFQGYDSLNSEKPPVIRPQATLPNFIPFSRAETFSQTSEEQTLQKISRQYNSKLNQNPKNVNLWIQFINAQEQSNYNSTSKTRNALLERQISIIEKALQHNPNHEDLAIIYLQRLLAKHIDLPLLIQKCLEFIKAQPHSLPLWKNYLYLQIGQFSAYSHEFARKVFEEMFQLFRSIVESARSAVQLWKIRKAGLQILKNIVTIYKLQGYGELATGIVLGLIEYNFFMPTDIAALTKNQDRVSRFGQYWENYQRFKIGEVVGECGWNSNLKVDTQTKQRLKFIGSKDNKSSTKKNIYQKQLQLNYIIWRPSHPLFDEDIIRQRPQSYILIEDIDFTLSWYRDSQSLMSLIDLMADHLELPLVFSVGDINSQFSFTLIEKALTLAIVDQKAFQFYKGQFFWWKRFWNLQHSASILSSTKIQKMQYFRRILQSVKPMLSGNTQKIDQYLMFVSCCYYLNSPIRDILQISQDDSLKLIEDLLAEQPQNIGAWCIYIETIFLIKSNREDCINCYLQLFQTVKMPGVQQNSNVTSDIFYWLWQFVKRHAPDLIKNTLKLYLRLLDQQKLEKYSLQEDLTEREEQRLQRYIKQKWNHITVQKETAVKQISNLLADVQMLLILLDCQKFRLFKNTLNLKTQIIQFFVNKVLTLPALSYSQFFILCASTNRHILDLAQIQQKQLTLKLPYIETIQYWVTINKELLITFVVNFQQTKIKNLPLWMTCSAFLFQKYNKKQLFRQYFYTISKAISESEKLVQAQYQILLNKLLLYDTNINHSQFIQSTIQKLPYCKDLYILGLISSNDHSTTNRMKALLQQKSIRIIEQQLFQ